MKQQFSKIWLESKQPRKQRKYRHNAPLHLRNKMMSAHLSSELRTRLGKRSIPVRKDDTVKVVRGSFRGKTGKIHSVNLKKSVIYIDGVDTSRRDGTKVLVPVNASNVVVIDVYTGDKKRLT